MDPTNDILIRKFETKDRAAVRAICCETAFLGQPSTVFFTDDEIFADTLTLPFTDFEPESCFVAEHHGQVIGYLIGSCDEKHLDKLAQKKVLRNLARKTFVRKNFWKGKNLCFIAHFLLSFLKGEFRGTPIPKDYPAVLHINLKNGFRGNGTGGELIQAFCEYLRHKNVPGIHLATMSEKSGLFFRKQGFALLYTGRRSYWRYLLGHDVPLYIYGKRLL